MATQRKCLTNHNREMKTINKQLMSFTQNMFFLFLREAGLSVSVAKNISRFRTISTVKSDSIKNLNSLLINMSKDRSHIAEAQKQRQKIKEKGSRYVPGTVTLQVLGSGALGTPSSVYLFTDQDRFASRSARFP